MEGGDLQPQEIVLSPINGGCSLAMGIPTFKEAVPPPPTLGAWEVLSEFQGSLSWVLMGSFGL